MPAANMGGSGSIGATLGNAVAKVAKPKSAGKTLGRSVGKTVGRGRRRSTPRSGGSGGGTRRSIPENRNRGGGGGNSGGPTKSIPEKRPTPAPGSIDSYLGTDSIFQSILSGSKKSLADFLSEMNRRRGEAGTQFNQTKASMERDRVQQLEALRDEFASRGLIQSGLYGEEQGRFQQQFTQQSQALQQQQAALLADLLSQEKNFRREQDLAIEAAKQEAIARRAAKFKL